MAKRNAPSNMLSPTPAHHASGAPASIDFKFVERSATVGVKPIGDLYAERKLEIDLDRAYKVQADMVRAKQERKSLRYKAKIARMEQVV